MYDFIDYFEKDQPSFLQREKFLSIINTIFKNMTEVEREAIAFQVRIIFIFSVVLRKIVYKLVHEQCPLFEIKKIHVRLGFYIGDTGVEVGRN